MKDEQIFVTKPSMPSYEEYIEAIKPLWDSKWLTNMGKYHMRLEEELAQYLQVPQISLMVNGHMALELAIQAFDFPKGSEVITTPFTFVSTTQAIVRNGLEPIFCDVKEEDGTIDETKIEKLITEKTVAIIPVHVYGNICNVEVIQKIANKYKLKVIYDAAHAFGESINGVGIGNFGDASIFSFHATKVFNTVEGGAVVCNNKDFYKKLAHLRDFGISNEETVVSFGTNGKMNEFSSIMGLCNLKHVEQSILCRKQAFQLYSEGLKKIKGIRMLIQDDNSNVLRNYGYNPIMLEHEFRYSRDDLYKKMRDSNIFVRKYFYPLTTDQKGFCDRYKDTDLNVSRYIAEHVLVLPLYEGIEKNKIARIIDLLKMV